MRKVSLLACVVPVVLVVACNTSAPVGPYLSLPSHVGVVHSAVVGGTLDSADPSVVELMYTASYAPSACNGNSTCLGTCYDTSTKASCTSGATCVCGSGETCTGELVGPQSVLTAGHCTDVTAGGEISGTGGPALKLCTTLADANNVLSGKTTASGCNLALLVLFENKCTTNDSSETCEGNLLQNGNFILADKVINPGYKGNVNQPYSASHLDNDIGLVHMSAKVQANGGGEPDILDINRTDLGASCSNLGSVKFVGYGITSGSGQTAGVKYTVKHTVAVKDTWHTEEGSGSLSSCSSSSGDPTCSGDSGGPSFDSQGNIIAVTSLGDANCAQYGQDTRVDAYASWIDTTMTGWGDPKNGTFQTPDGGGADVCQMCFNSAQQSSGACASQGTACNNDQACNDFFTCLGNCAAGNTGCVTTCKNTAGAAAVSEYTALIDCACNACATPCASSCGPAKADGGASSGGDGGAGNGGGSGSGGGNGGAGNGGGGDGGGNGNGDTTNGNGSSSSFGNDGSSSSGCSFVSATQTGAGSSSAFGLLFLGLAAVRRRARRRG